MIIKCPECGKKYKIDPERVPEKGAKITCPNCGHSFIVRRKKEKEKGKPAPSIKTPPCAICGSPSTRVLQGDPPLLLCEDCFRREKEKRQRFEIHPPEFIEEKPEQVPPSEEFEDTTEKIPPEEKPPAEEKEEEEYFDSFAEVPDMGNFDVEAKEPEITPPEPTFEHPPPPQPEEPIFEEQEFEELERELEKPAEEEQVEASEESSEFVFSPEEVSRLEETAPTEPQAPFPKEPSFAESEPEFKPEPELEKPKPEPKEIEQRLEEEIFAELKEETAPKEKPKKPPRRKISLKIPWKKVAGALVVLMLLAGGYWALKNPQLRSKFKHFSGKITGLIKKKPALPKALTKEQIKILNEHLALAQNLYKLDTKKAYLKAIDEIRSAQKIDPANINAKKFELLVSSLFAFREPKKLFILRAKRLLKKSPPEVVLSPEGQVSKALVFLAEGEIAPSKLIIEGILKKNPDYPLALWVMAYIVQKSAVGKNIEQVENLLKKALEQDPNLVQARWELAELYFNTKQYEKAKEEYEKISQLSPDKEGLKNRLSQLTTILSVKAKKEEKKELLVEKKPEEKPAELIPLKIQAKPEQEKEEQKPQKPEVDVDKELQNYFLKIISETRKPMSRIRAKFTQPSAPPHAPSPKAPSRPPEEAPDHPPEEAP